MAHERARDDPSQIGPALLRLAAEADLVCTTGGASVGTRDHLIDLLGSLGTVEVHQVAIRPGRPTSMGLIGATPVFVLPGNPLALLVGFEAIVRPAVRRLAGDVEMLRPSCECVAGGLIDRHARLELVPVRLSSGSPPTATPVRQLGSAMLAGAAVADGLAFIEAGYGSIGPGERFIVERWTAAAD
ncbi:MAG: molybdopterin-binding protein [Aeromicrobium sp.]